MQRTIVIRNTIALILLLLGIYLSISAIIALPLLEEETGSKQEALFAFNEQIDKRRDLSTKYIEEIAVDSITEVMYNDVNSLLESQSKGLKISVQLKSSKNNLLRNIANRAEDYKRRFIRTKIMGKFQKSCFAAQLMSEYSDFCTINEQEVFNRYQAISIQTAKLYPFALKDTSKNRIETRREKAKMRNLFVGFITMDIPEKEEKAETSASFFYPAQWALAEQSQNLVIIIGLFGFALFGSVLGAFSKPSFANVNPEGERTDGLIYYEIIVVLVRGFSAALVVYLSIKGGLSLVTTTNSDKINPYVILFICFISAVFSDTIWEWAKTKLMPGSTSTTTQPTETVASQDGKSIVQDPLISELAYESTRAEIPAGEAQDPSQVPAGRQTSITLEQVSDATIAEAIQNKSVEWKAAFGIREAKAGKHINSAGEEINAIVFVLDKNNFNDADYRAELPSVITYYANDKKEYNIPIEIIT
ncbi:hypothetical protein [Pedobacter sp. MW01-1-1]|uniref:hypothetical protein n=1 Tax=Pedobacter sp. MW01-1-1 TaxID=3383027 RepID=UPI003FEE0310